MHVGPRSVSAAPVAVRAQVLVHVPLHMLFLSVLEVPERKIFFGRALRARMRQRMTRQVLQVGWTRAPRAQVQPTSFDFSYRMSAQRARLHPSPSSVVSHRVFWLSARRERRA